jgi:hypothetical protein
MASLWNLVERTHLSCSLPTLQDEASIQRRYAPPLVSTFFLSYVSNALVLNSCIECDADNDAEDVQFAKMHVIIGMVDKHGMCGVRD